FCFLCRNRFRPNCGWCQEALRLLLLFGFFIALEGILEVADAFSQTFRHLRDLLPAEKQDCDAQNDEKFRQAYGPHAASFSTLPYHCKTCVSAASRRPMPVGTGASPGYCRFSHIHDTLLSSAPPLNVAFLIDVLRFPDDPVLPVLACFQGTRSRS